MSQLSEAAKGRIFKTSLKLLGTHTHPFNGLFSGTTQVSRYQKGKTNLDFTEAKDSEWQWHQLGHMQGCILLQTDNSVFYRPDALHAAQPTASKHYRHRAIVQFCLCVPTFSRLSRTPTCDRQMDIGP